jgi:hypothetical protein
LLFVFVFFFSHSAVPRSTMADASSDGSSSSDSGDVGEGNSSDFVPSQTPVKEPAKKKKKDAESYASADVSGNGGSDAEADGAEGSSDEDIKQPVPADVALAASVLLMSASSVQGLVDKINAACVREGYPKLHQKLVRSNRAYFFCGCQDRSCFKLTLQLAKKGAVSSALSCSVASVGVRVCFPVKPYAGALLNSFIPFVVKNHLVVFVR